MKNPLKSLLASALMVGMLVTFCDPSQAAVTGNHDSMDAENGTSTLVVRYHVTNTGFVDVTAVQDLAVHPLPDEGVVAASSSKNTFAAGQTITYDYNTCDVSHLAHGNYIIYGHLTVIDQDDLASDEWGLLVEPGP